MKISCNVVQDLMQPYAEGILSDDSIKLVNEHVAECCTCKEKLDEIRSINQELDGKIEAGTISATQDHDQDAVTFRNFKKRINSQRVLAIIVTLVLTFTFCFGVFYYIETFQNYIPFEETDITVDGNVIYMNKAYQVNTTELRVRNDGDDGVHDILFVYLSSSFHTRHFEKPGDLKIALEIKKQGGKVEGDGFALLDTNVTEVYYASEAFLRKQRSIDYKREQLISSEISEDERQEIFEEIRADSTLLWKKG